jgi:hypothetical protein
MVQLHSVLACGVCEGILRVGLGLVEALVLAEDAADFALRRWTFLEAIGAIVGGRGGQIERSFHHGLHVDNWGGFRLEQAHQVAATVQVGPRHRADAVSEQVLIIFVNNFRLNYLHVGVVIKLHALHRLQCQLGLRWCPLRVGVVPALNVGGRQSVEERGVSIYLFGLLENQPGSLLNSPFEVFLLGREVLQIAEDVVHDVLRIQVYKRQLNGVNVLRLDQVLRLALILAHRVRLQTNVAVVRWQNFVEYRRTRLDGRFSLLGGSLLLRLRLHVFVCCLPRFDSQILLLVPSPLDSIALVFCWKKKTGE